MATTILGTIDAGGEGKAVLLAALNQALGKNFTLAEFTFSDPVAITIPTPTRNTMIKLAPWLLAVTMAFVKSTTIVSMFLNLVRLL